MVQVEFFGLHLQFDECPAVGIRHTEGDALRSDTETGGLDVVVEEFEKDLHDVGIGGLAPKDIFFLVHGCCCFFLVLAIFK